MRRDGTREEERRGGMGNGKWGHMPLCTFQCGSRADEDPRSVVHTGILLYGNANHIILQVPRPPEKNGW